MEASRYVANVPGSRLLSAVIILFTRLVLKDKHLKFDWRHVSPAYQPASRCELLQRLNDGDWILLDPLN
jgi:hypothetical protein